MSHVKPLHPDLAGIIDHQCTKALLGGWAGISIFAAMAGFFLYWGIKIPFVFLLIFGGIAALAPFLLYIKFKGDFKGASYWIDLLQSRPEEIIWIKPVITKHTLGFIVTLYQERSFELYTKDGLRLRLEIDSLQDHRLFFDAIRTHLPLAHIGYSESVKSCYSENRSQFLQILQEKNGYMPISAFPEQ